MTVTLRYWAAAKDAAGVAEETYGDVVDLAALLAAAVAAHPGSGANPGGTGTGTGTGTGVGVGRLGRVLARCSFLVDGDPVGLRDHARVQLRDGAVVEALPPFAGG